MYDQFNPNFYAHLEDDSAMIQAAVDAAAETGEAVTVPRYNARTGKRIWDINRAILLHTGTVIYLDNCHLRQADGCYDNIFRSFRDTETQGHTHEEQKQNITIRGLGHAILDGGIHNGLTQKNSGTEGLPNITRNNLILLYNVRDFVLENFEVNGKKIDTAEGYVKEIKFDDINEDGMSTGEGKFNVIEII